VSEQIVCDMFHRSGGGQVGCLGIAIDFKDYKDLD
jgi:hypothetical protein